MRSGRARARARGRERGAGAGADAGAELLARCGCSFDQANEHRGDSVEEFETRVNGGLIRSTFRDDIVHRSSTLGSRPFGDSAEPRFLLWAVLAAALGDVEDDRRRCAPQLIGNARRSWRQTLPQLVCDPNESDSHLVHVETLMIE